MSLTGTLNIGTTALSASQLAIQVAGQNLSNIATPGYSRQTAHLAPIAGAGPASAGRGVGILGIQRHVDEALLARVRAGGSAEARAEQRLAVLTQLETVLGELGTQDLSTELSNFFNSWSERANQTQSSALVVERGDRLAEMLRTLRTDIAAQQRQVDDTLSATVTRADAILSEIAGLNVQIAKAGPAGAALKDRRDELLAELSRAMDISVAHDRSGAVNVYAGSTPLVLGNTSRGLRIATGTDPDTGAPRPEVTVRSDGQTLPIHGGAIGALLGERQGALAATINSLDTLAAQLIFEVNRIHSTGAPTQPMTSLTGSLRMAAADVSRALNSPDNTTLRDLPYEPVTGGFIVHVRHSGTGATQSVRINVDLDGINADGSAGFDDDTSLADLRDALAAVPGLSASIGPDGRLAINADAGHEVAFSDDTSGVLAVLGVGGYFQGSTAADIAVRSDLLAQPNRLAVGRMNGSGVVIDNGAALSIALLQDQPLPAIGNQTLRESWNTGIQSLAVRTASAAVDADSTRIVREGLDAHRASVSGVSVDEEATNLIILQQAYQGAARLIAMADELTQTLVNLV